MEQSSFTVRVEFTPETSAAFPALHGWKASFPATLNPLVIASVQRGDSLRMQGVPVSRALVVLGRAWEVMKDEATLTLLLAVADD